MPAEDTSSLSELAKNRENWNPDFFERIYSSDCNQWPAIQKAVTQEDYKALSAAFTAWKKDSKKLPSGYVQDQENNTDFVFEQLYFSGGKSPKPLQIIRNFEIVLKLDVRFSGKIGYDMFDQKTYLLGEVPWLRPGEPNIRPWTNTDDRQLLSIMQVDYMLKSKEMLVDAVDIVSKNNSFHPVCDLLDGLQWDGNPHIENLLHDYLGAEKNGYNSSVLKLWMLGAVARVYEPGCKFDYTMIIKGPQGIGKSTFLRNLSMNDQWFCDNLDSLDGDKAVQTLLGSWIIELAELKSLTRTGGGVESVKRFLTAQQDKIRIPYERRSETYFRQCVFAGTTNKDSFLQDETGNRRFLVVEAGIHSQTKSLFNESCMDDFRQAWAEAVHIYKTESPVLTLPSEYKDCALEKQENALLDDGMKGLIELYLEDKTRVCVPEIWEKALHEKGRPPKWQSSVIGDIIINQIGNGWQRMKSPTRFGEYGNQRGFQKVATKSMLQSELQQSEFVAASDEAMRMFP